MVQNSKPLETEDRINLSLTLSTQDNAKLLQQLSLVFRQTTNWNRYQLKVLKQAQNQYIDYLIDTSFQGVNRLFVLSFEKETNRRGPTRYYFPTLKKYTMLQC